MSDYEYAPTEQGGLSAFYTQLDGRKAESVPAPQTTDPIALPAVPHTALQRAQDAATNAAVADLWPRDPLHELEFAKVYAAIAQAEALTRQAEVMESLLEYLSDMISHTDLVDGLLQWSYRQRI